MAGGARRCQWRHLERLVRPHSRHKLAATPGYLGDGIGSIQNYVEQSRVSYKLCHSAVPQKRLDTARDRCRVERARLREIADAHLSACHLKTRWQWPNSKASKDSKKIGTFNENASFHCARLFVVGGSIAGGARS
jgi:hypothetical protein